MLRLSASFRNGLQQNTDNFIGSVDNMIGSEGADLIMTAEAPCHEGAAAACRPCGFEINLGITDIQNILHCGTDTAAAGKQRLR